MEDTSLDTTLFGDEKESTSEEKKKTVKSEDILKRKTADHKSLFI